MDACYCSFDYVNGCFMLEKKFTQDGVFIKDRRFYIQKGVYDGKNERFGVFVSGMLLHTFIYYESAKLFINNCYRFNYADSEILQKLDGNQLFNFFRDIRRNKKEHEYWTREEEEYQDGLEELIKYDY